MIPRPAIFDLITPFARERALSYATLADMCGVTVATLARWRKCHYTTACNHARIMLALLASERGGELQAVQTARQSCGLPPSTTRVRSRPWSKRYSKGN